MSEACFQYFQATHKLLTTTYEKAEMIYSDRVCPLIQRIHVGTLMHELPEEQVRVLRDDLS